MVMPWPAWAALTDCRRPGRWTAGMDFAQLRGWKSEIKVPAALVSGGTPVLGLNPWGLSLLVRTPVLTVNLNDFFLGPSPRNPGL